MWRSSAIRKSCIPSGRFIWKSCYYLEILLVQGLLINCSYYFLYPDHAITPYTTENTSAAYFQNTFSQEHLWVAASVYSNKIIYKVWLKMSVSTTEEKNAVRSSHQRCSIKKGVLRPQTCNFIKKRLWHTCIPVNFAKFLRTPFSKNTSGWLLLCCVMQVMRDEGFVNRLYYITVL